MKKTSVILLTLGILIYSFTGFAQDNPKESFYRDCVTKSLNKFEGKKDNLESDRPAIKRDAAVATLKAEYIRSHEDELIQQMCAQDLDESQGDVDYFLIKSFGAFMGDDLDRAVADVMKGDESAKEIYEAYSTEKK